MNASITDGLIPSYEDETLQPMNAFIADGLYHHIYLGSRNYNT
jgi:hypothetical protein